MDNVAEKPSLEELLDQDLKDMINAMAAKYMAPFASKPHGSMISHADVVSEGMIGVMRAYNAFDPNGGAAFKTFAFTPIRNAMLAYCRKFSHTLTISEKAARDDMGTLNGIGVVHIDQLNVDEGETFDIPVGSGVEVQNDAEEFFFRGFTDFEAQLARDHLVEGYSLQEIAMRHDMSKTRAREIIQELKVRMQSRADRYVKND